MEDPSEEIKLKEPPKSPIQCSDNDDDQGDETDKCA